jgi:hypothetical protein
MADVRPAYHADTISSTYTARTNELIYRHLRTQLDSDDDIKEIIIKIMNRPAPRIGYQILGDLMNTSKTLFGQIEYWYDEWKRLEFERYLVHIRNRFEKVQGEDQGHGLQDPEFRMAEFWLGHYVGVAEGQLQQDQDDET